MSELAKALELSPASVSRIETNVNQPSPSTLSRICEYFRFSAADFYAPAEPDVVAVTGYPIPLLKQAEVASFLAPGSETGGFAPGSGMILSTRQLPDQSFALIVQDDSMEPRFHEGDMVIVDPTVQPGKADTVVAKDAGGKVYLRRYHGRGNDPATGTARFELAPLNDAHETLYSTEQPIELLGTVVESRKVWRR